MKKRMAVAGLLTITSILLISGGNIPKSYAANAALEASKLNIDARITGHEREIMAQVMKGLSKEEQENVTYIDENGNVYSNKPELKDNVMKFEKIEKALFKQQIQQQDQLQESSGILYENEDGEVFVFPEQEENPYDTLEVGVPATETIADSLYYNNNITTLATYPSLSGGSGPYRRVFSSPNYSWAQASVYLPGGNSIKSQNQANTTATGTHDTGYVYMGGWGANGGAVDAGFMHSATNSNWATMTQVNGTPHGYTDRLDPAQTVTFKFWVNANGQITFYVYGKDFNTHAYTNYTHIEAAPGFTTGGGNIIKRMTTIGQAPYQGLHSGAYIKGVQWSNVLIGTSQTSNHTWSNSDQATNAPDNSNGYHTYTPDVVSYLFVSASNETDSIDLNW